jgi:hypothetical protein
MKTRLVVPLVGLAISFAFPTYAQQKDVADPQTTQKILAICKAIDEAVNNNDPAARAAPFTRDAVFVTPDGQPITGRQAIHSALAVRRSITGRPNETRRHVLLALGISLRPGSQCYFGDSS